MSFEHWLWSGYKVSDDDANETKLSKEKYLQQKNRVPALKLYLAFNEQIIMKPLINALH